VRRRPDCSNSVHREVTEWSEQSRRRTDTFSAQDASGKTCAIHVYTNFIRIETFGGHSEEVEGLPELVTATGDKVNRVKQGEYQIVVTGERLTSTAPNAV